MRFLSALYRVFALFRDLTFAAVMAAAVAFVWLAADELPIGLPSPKRSYDAAPAPVQFARNLDPALSTTAPGLTDAQRTERLLRATVRVTSGRALGSGVFVDNVACHVVTNEHVISSPGTLRVTYITRFRPDGSAVTRTVEAEIVGRPTDANDLAVLRLASCADAVWAPLGDSEALRHGDVVRAIGHPNGQFWTLTQGVVSQPRRQMEDVTNASGWELVQVDAAINSGNSGGPLFDRSGAVVGINTLKRTDGENLGYALPANLVDAYLAYLSFRGQMPSYVLGISVRQHDEETARAAGVPATLVRDGTFGLSVLGVNDGSVAARLGLREGDVLLAVNDDGVYDVHRLRRLLYTHAPHGPLTLLVLRDGRLGTLAVTLD
jgi:S1-C subfamily serine protease